MTDRAEVYAVIDGERAYQEQRWGVAAAEGRTEADHDHSVTEWLSYIRDYVEEGLHVCARTADPIATAQALHIVRKVAGMAVACMEQRGAPARPGFEPADPRSVRTGMKL
jgi:hypothetical protein